MVVPAQRPRPPITTVLPRVLAITCLAVLLAGCFGPFPVSGQVVDEHGNPLRDVRLHTTAAVSTDRSFDEYGGERSFQLEDGEFSVSCWNCSAMHLFFSKEGYHPRPVDLAFFEWWRDVEVVLVKKGVPVDLSRHEATLTAGPGFDDTVLRFTQLQSQTSPLSELTSLASPPVYVALKPAMRPDGQLATTVKEFAPHVDFVDLDFSTANGAAQLYEPSEIAITYALAEMTTAPTEGFTPSVRLQGKLPGQVYYFYCIVNGHYCKGTITTPGTWVSDDRSTVRASIELFVNPTREHRGLDDPRGYLN